MNGLSIKEVFKSANKINVDVILAEEGTILNDGIVIEDTRVHK